MYEQLAIKEYYCSLSFKFTAPTNEGKMQSTAARFLWLSTQEYLWIGFLVGVSIAFRLYGINERVRFRGKIAFYAFLFATLLCIHWTVEAYLNGLNQFRDPHFPSWWTSFFFERRVIVELRQWVFGATFALGLYCLIASWALKRLDPMVFAYFCLTTAFSLLEWSAFK